MKTAPLAIVPELEELLAFPYDKLAINEIASAIGWQRDLVRHAMKRGDIPCIELQAVRSDDPRRATRRASKAAVIQWLWRNLRGDKNLWRAYLCEKWPALLERLETDHPAFELVAPEPCEAAKAKIIPHPNARAKRAAALPAPPEHPGQLHLFPLAS